ncbi:DeoR/GlpR family DNA-binding transcription regulator [Alkalibacterium indicireducens]|uniref:DeoR/GlpR family DNA-binding transcription regulator n=2 Tax=Alkalibacterium indicireducens TaxID=398758 RepID=A0ABN1B4P3_9LACT
MIPYVRQKRILEELEKNDVLFIENIVDVFPKYSESTIRRDLKVLEEENYVTLLRGGGVKLKGASHEVPANEKLHLNKDAKEYIAKIAATTVQDNDVIYIDSGTTTLAMVKYIVAKNVKVITTNTHLLMEQRNTNITSFYTLSGVVNYTIGSISGSSTDKDMSNLFFDKSYLGSTGFGINVGINTPDIKEATKKIIALRNSSQTYVLADVTKYNKKALSKAFDVKDCILITDQKIPEFDKENIKYMYS